MNQSGIHHKIGGIYEELGIGLSRTGANCLHDKGRKGKGKTTSANSFSRGIKKPGVREETQTRSETLRLNILDREKGWNEGRNKEREKKRWP